MSGSTVLMGQDFKGDRGSVVAAVVYTADAPGTGTDCSPWDGSVAANLVTGMIQANGDYTRDGVSEQYGPVMHSLGWGIDGVTWRPIPLKVPGDSDAQPTNGIVDCIAKLQFWTGTEWRRVRGIGNTGAAAGAAGAVNVAAYLFGWDGAQHNPARQKAQDATGLAVGTYGLQTASQLYALSTANVATPCRNDDNGSQIVTPTDPSLATAPTSSSLYTKGGTTVSAAVKTSAGRLFSISARISHATAAGAWLQLFNKNGAPAAADACIWQMWVPVNTAADLSVTAGRDHFGPQGYAFSAGLSWGVSTTADTFTAIGAVVNGSVNISYK